MQRSGQNAIRKWGFGASLCLVTALSGCGDNALFAEGGFFAGRSAPVPLEQLDAATIFQRGEAALAADDPEEAAALFIRSSAFTPIRNGRAVA